MEIRRCDNISIQRVKYFILAAVVLFAGLLIYLIYRPNSYISKLVLRLIPLYIPKNPPLAGRRFLRFYIADYLWAFGLSCCLRCILTDKSQKKLCFAITSFMGIIYEFMQCFDIIPGTGDICDCVLYLLAGLTVSILN